MSAELLDLTLSQHAETDRAYGVSDTGDRADIVWLPKSQVERGARKSAGIYEFTVPEWLALDKGLI